MTPARWLLALLVLGAPAAFAQQVPASGNAPSYTNRALSDVPNAGAIRARIWAPRLDDGWVPQGVAFGDGALWVSAYQSTDPNIDSGPCRVFKVNVADGGMAGQFDLPATCTHAGGLAHTGDRYLYVADAGYLFRVDTQAALAAGRCVDLGCSTLPLRGSLRGSFLAYAKRTLWLGESVPTGQTARLWQIPEARVLAIIAGSGDTLDEHSSVAVTPLAARSQGVAITRDGALWITQSDAKSGLLQKVEPGTGKVLQEYAMAAGVGDIDFAPDGTLWALSEAGSMRRNAWPTFFPLLFSLDPAALH